MVHDEQWFSRLRAISTQYNELYWLQDHARINQQEREAFLNDEIENPRFQYRKNQHINENVTAARELQTEIEHSDVLPVVIDLYIRKIENQIIRRQMIDASSSANDGLFYELSTQLYGKPRSRYFSYVAQRVNGLCDEQAKKHPTVAKRLQKVVSKITPNDDIDAGILPPVVTNGSPVDSITDVENIFLETLERYSISGWELAIDKTETRSIFSVNPHQKIIHIPAASRLFQRPKPLTDVQLYALAEHEVGVHARRSFEAAKTPLLLLQIGLDSYTKGEEGLASYVQQQIEGADEFYGFDRYLAACLAIGLDGTPRDFRAVFSLMTDYYTLRQARTKEMKVSAQQAAWDVCVRIFRGTTGERVGCIYTKDIVYFEGNIKMWHLLSEKPHIFESLFVGKFNPFMKRHITSLQTLGILEEW